jgi:competence protein ComEC
MLLVPGETITIFSGKGTLNNTALFMGKTEPVWGNSGDIAILKDGSGKIIDQRSK